ncbi:hypothetical protein MRX96_028445 [Rhipicephalus microplus]
MNWCVATTEDLAAVSVHLIRTEFQCRSLSTTGNKEELIDRLLVGIAKDPPPAHKSERSASDISTPLASMPAPMVSFPAMPSFPSDPAENIQRMAAFLHQNMAAMMTTMRVISSALKKPAAATPIKTPQTNTTLRHLCSLPQMGQPMLALFAPEKTTYKPQQLERPPPSSTVLDSMEGPNVFITDMPMHSTANLEARLQLFDLLHVALLLFRETIDPPCLGSAAHYGLLAWWWSSDAERMHFLEAAKTRPAIVAPC